MIVVYTVGYQGASVDHFVAALAASEIEVVADVRAVPVSRKPGFSKSALRDRLDAAGIVYRHFAALGTPKAGRDAARAGRRDEFRRVYDAQLASAEAQAALCDLAALVRARRTCLLCYERDPAACHRSILAGRLAPPDLAVRDLFVDPTG